MQLTCFFCHKTVSTPVPEETVLRGTIECPECTAKQGDAYGNNIAQMIFRMETNLNVIERRISDVPGTIALNAIRDDIEHLKEFKQKIYG